MPKFSIIIPVYNVEEYIKECLDSVMNQSEKDFEVIVVNDGTKDNSMKIVEEYDVTVINQKNQGLSVARNNGAKKAKGEYLLFVDSDDTLEKDLLKKLKSAAKDNPDMIRYQIRKTYSRSEDIDLEEEPFDSCNGVEAFEKICKYHIVEAATCYAIRRSYFEKEKFAFAKGMIHEDFGLIPLMIMKSKKIKSISYIGYNYRQRENSIMNTNDYPKRKKKVEDFYRHYCFLMEEINKTELDSKVFKSFIANSLILKITELEGKDYKEYKKKLVDQKVFDQILSDSVKRRIKRWILRISPKLYYGKR